MSDNANSTISPVDEILEIETVAGIRVWQALFIATSTLLLLSILICCCVNFRIPRTKQEIEADYVRKQITRKFRQQLNLLPDSDMEEMDLRKAVDKVRFELMSEEEKVFYLKMITIKPMDEGEEQSTHHKSEIPEKMSSAAGNSSAALLLPSEEKLEKKDSTSNHGAFTNKLITIVSVFSILRLKRTSMGESSASKNLTV